MTEERGGVHRIKSHYRHGPRRAIIRLMKKEAFAMMETFKLDGTQGALIQGYCLQPNKKPVKVLHILHGMGEHAQRYETFARAMTEHGIAVYAHDHRAHGQSLMPAQTVGILSGADSLETIVDDVEIVQDYIRQNHPDVTVMMLGHSMGSVILRAYLEQTSRTFDRIVIMGSPPYYGAVYTKMMRLLGKVMATRKKPTARHDKLADLLNDGLIKKIPHAQTAFDWLSYDQANVKAYEEDPACGYAYNAPFYLSFFALLDRVNSRRCIAMQPPVPTLLICGADDPLNPSDKTLTQLSIRYRQAHPDMTLEVISVSRARHEVLNELNKADTFTKLAQFFA